MYVYGHNNGMKLLPTGKAHAKMHFGIKDEGAQFNGSFSCKLQVENGY